MVQNTKAPRGRPKAYDADIALAAAMGVFWDKGFAATSLDDIVAATKMNRPSLYAAFGDKRAIYAKALARYRAASRASLGKALAHEHPLPLALRNVYRLALDSYLPKNRAGRGCFMIGSALTEAVTDAGVRKGVGEGLKALEALFADRIAWSRAQGEACGEPAALAKIAAAALYSMSVQARAGESRKNLEAIGEAAIGVICIRSQPRQRR